MQKAQQAKQETDAANELEEIKLAVVSAMVNGTDGKVSAENLRTALTGIIDNTSGITGNGPWTITGKSGTEYKIYSNGQVEKQTSQSSQPSQSSSNLAPGIYDENDQIVWTWDEFLEQGFWTVDSNGVLEIDYATIENAMMNGMTQEEAMEYVSSIKKVILPDGITGLGDYVFENCQSLSSIEIPNSVTSIGEGAFWDCTSLSSINVNESNANYASVDGVLFNKNKTELILYPEGNTATSYSIPNSVTSIREFAFSPCSSLSSIEIPSSVTSIGAGAFDGCTSLSSVEIPNSVTAIYDWTFQDCTSLSSIRIPGSVTSIGSDVFVGCTSLSSIEIPNGVTSIGHTVFAGCTSLSSIEIANTVTSIGTNTFVGCTSLSSIKIPNSVTSIEHLTFQNCTSLSSIEIPSTIISIDEYAFSGCTSLRSINVNESNANYFSEDGVLFNKDKTKLVIYPAGKTTTSYSIPNSVTMIGRVAFSGCTNLSSINVNESNTAYASEDGVLFNKNKTALIFYPLGKTTTSYSIPNSVKSIYTKAFAGCTNLSSIEIPNSVTSIGDNAFSECTNLSSIEIPSSVTSIGIGAFYGCTSLSSITIHKNNGSISGSPWGAPNATVSWVGTD